MSLKHLLSSQYILSPHHLLGEYFFPFILLVVSLSISRPVSALSFFLSSRSVDKEKVSAYECGFSPFEDARNQFDVRFYSVAILSITSDPEVSFSFPRAVTLNQITIFGFRSMFFSPSPPTVGFIHE
jgi:NADH-quinone oxidoreductase subunit A